MQTYNVSAGSVKDYLSRALFHETWTIIYIRWKKIAPSRGAERTKGASFLLKEVWVVLITNHSWPLLLCLRGTNVPHFCRLCLKQCHLNSIKYSPQITFISGTDFQEQLLIWGIVAEILLIVCTPLMRSVYQRHTECDNHRHFVDEAESLCGWRWIRAESEVGIFLYVCVWVFNFTWPFLHISNFSKCNYYNPSD